MVKLQQLLQYNGYTVFVGEIWALVKLCWAHQRPGALASAFACRASTFKRFHAEHVAFARQQRSLLGNLQQSGPF